MSTKKAPVLPSTNLNGDVIPWGGKNPAGWKAEAKLANAACELLNTYWATPNVAEVIASVPIAMDLSNYHPYCDGQSNTRVNFNSWTASFPPVIATFVQYTNNTNKIFFRVHTDLPLENDKFEVEFYNSNNEQVTRSFTGTKQKNVTGDATYWGFSWDIVATDKINITALTHFAFVLRPDGWNDCFPLSFLMPSQPLSKLVASIPAGLSKFKDGGDIVDHEKATSQGNPADPSKTPFDRMMSTPRSPAYLFNDRDGPFEPDNIHAAYPDPNSPGKYIVTGVGQGWTWVAGGLENIDASLAPYKTMYTFFQARQPDKEAQFGVTSGCGWHQVGDPAETFCNDLETHPILTGFGLTNMPPTSELKSGGFAYGLNLTTAFRLLWPGETFTCRQRVQYVDRDGTKWNQDSFQWYAFHTDKNVGMEEWVHPCIPDNSFGFCPNPFVYTPVVNWCTNPPY